jgi:hypothetical protein
MSVTYNPAVIRDGLLTYVDFSNNKCSPKTGTSLVTITDLVPNGMNWTTYNNTVVNSSFVTTDGNTGYIYSSTTTHKNTWTPDGAYGSNRMTIETIFKSSDTGGYIVSRPWNGSGQYNYLFQNHQMTLYANASSTALSYGISICNGANVHMAWWMDETSMGWYKNGNEASGSVAHNLTVGGGSSGNLVFGTLLGSLYPYGQGWAGNPAFSTAADFYSCRIYNRKLTPEEILRNFNATRGKYNL